MGHKSKAKNKARANRANSQNYNQNINAEPNAPVVQVQPRTKARFDLNKYNDVIDFKKAVHTLLIPSIENLPNEWVIRDFDANSVWVVNEAKQLGAIISYNFYGGKVWLHLSCSHSKRCPSHNELKDMKFLFFQDRKAIQVFPGKDEYVNDHENCLHLFTPVDDFTLPDFRVTVNGIVTI